MVFRLCLCMHCQTTALGPVVEMVWVLTMDGRKPIIPSSWTSAGLFVARIERRFLSSGRHLALGSEDPRFQCWFCQVNFESLKKALYMHFLTQLMCKTNIRL